MKISESPEPLVIAVIIVLQVLKTRGNSDHTLKDRVKRIKNDNGSLGQTEPNRTIKWAVSTAITTKKFRKYRAPIKF